MADTTKEVKPTKEQVKEFKHKKFSAGRELKKSELPGVVETASLGEIKKPKPTK